MEVTDIGVAFDAAVVNAVQGTSALPAVFRGTQFIADTTASLHLDQFDDETQIVDDNRPRVLQTPDPSITYHEFMNRLVLSLIYRGNAYLRPVTRDRVGNITSVHVLHPDEVSVTWDRNRIYPVYAWRDRNMVRDKDLIHIPLNLMPGEVEGKGPITMAATMLAAAEAEQDFQHTLFRDNATPTGLLIVQNKTQTEVDAIQAKIDEKAATGSRTPRVISNAEWKQLTINPADAEFLEARNFTIQDIARLFGIPGLFLGVATGDSLTYSTTESLNRLFISTTLRPTYLERIEQAFGRLLPRGKSARFNTSELLRADVKARYESYEIGLNNKFLTVNDVRQMEGLKPIPGGDVIAPTPQPPVAQNGSAQPQEMANA